MLQLRPDSKGRISLGTLSKGISSFKVTVDKKQRIILEPLVEIPVREKWLFESPEALSQLKQGLKDSANGEITPYDFSDDKNDVL